MKNFSVCCLVLMIGCCSAFAQTEIDSVYNKDRSFTLVKNDTVNASGIPVLKYKVIRRADKRMVMEGSVAMGVLEWTADYELTESKSLGTGTSTPKQTRKIDLRPYLIKP